MTNNQNVSLPFSWSPSQSWDGNAGSWSSFTLRIGTPSQDFRIFPSTNGQEIFIPVPQGCTSTDPSNCGDLRGVFSFQGSPSNGFQVNQSSTWVPNGIFDLDIENGLNLTGNGEFGYDTVGLGVQNSNGLTLKHQVAAGIATKDFYIGQFGLGPKPANFSGLDTPVPNYMKNLADQNLIPSLSFGYTAGAKYRLNRVLGSLTLGGYDAARFVPNNLSYPFDADDSRSLTVGLQSIIVSDSLLGVLTPLTNGAFFLIDSTVPDIWLPTSACQLFEQAFGLIYDNVTDLYLVNASAHIRLQQLNPTITFKLGISAFEPPFIDISLPYAAFDLQASSPFYPNATNYFPIRRAANSTQYTLGRTFLQEAYIIVDYERSNFTVNQAVFADPSPQKIEAIRSTNQSSSTSTSTTHGPPGGTVAGIVVGAVALFAISIAVIVLNHRRLRRNIRGNSTTIPDLVEPESPKGDPAEMSAVRSHELVNEEVHTQQLDSTLLGPSYELNGSSSGLPSLS